MGSKHLGADVNLAWPTAQIAVIGAQGAVGILYRKELGRRPTDPDARRAELIAEYEDTLANPYIAADRGYVDAVIPPSHTRVQVDQGAAGAGQQAPDPAAQEAREHPAVTSRSSGPHRDQEPSPATRAARRPIAGPSGPHSRRYRSCASSRASRRAEELAALTVVVAALSQRRDRRRPTPVGAWASYGRRHRAPLQPGPGGWRAAGRFA